MQNCTFHFRWTAVLIAVVKSSLGEDFIVKYGKNLFLTFDVEANRVGFCSNTYQLTNLSTKLRPGRVSVHLHFITSFSRWLIHSDYHVMKITVDFIPFTKLTQFQRFQTPKKGSPVVKHPHSLTLPQLPCPHARSD